MSIFFGILGANRTEDLLVARNEIVSSFISNSLYQDNLWILMIWKETSTVFVMACAVILMMIHWITFRFLISLIFLKNMFFIYGNINKNSYFFAMNACSKHSWVSNMIVILGSLNHIIESKSCIEDFHCLLWGHFFGVHLMI